MYLEEYTNYSISYGKTEKIGNAKNNDTCQEVLRVSITQT